MTAVTLHWPWDAFSSLSLSLSLSLFLLFFLCTCRSLLLARSFARSTVIDHWIVFSIHFFQISIFANENVWFLRTPATIICFIGLRDGIDGRDSSTIRFLDPLVERRSDHVDTIEHDRPSKFSDTSFQGKRLLLKFLHLAMIRRVA